MIRVTKGTIGYWDGHKIVLVTAKSGMVRLRPEAERRFVTLGVAEYAGDPDTDGSSDDIVDESMSTKDLREIAKSRGITFKVGTTKQEMIDILNSGDKSGENDLNSDKSDGNESDEDESNAPDAPSFDAVDSVR